MAVSYSSVSFLLFLGVLRLLSVGGRHLLLSPERPLPDDAADFARWLITTSSWGVLNTISIEWDGSPFGNVVSFSDGLPDEEGKGIPYFYLSPLDPTPNDAMRDRRSSFTVSEYALGTCSDKDPENPSCAKITLLGKLEEVVKGNSSSEWEFARNALFSKHPEMIGWPENHHFEVFKLEIENVFLVNWFGGRKTVTVDQYLNASGNGGRAS